MEIYIKNVITKFHEQLQKIIGDKIIDIVIHGSTVDGSFIQGKGDIDFIVLLNHDISGDEYSQLISYHHKLRENKNLESQLEGCYLILSNNRMTIEGGIYIGSTESRWKRFSNDIFTNLDKAHISAIHYSHYNRSDINHVFDYNWYDVKTEIRRNIDETRSLMAQIDDYDFKLHALHSSARSYYTFKNEIFVSKIQALELLGNEDEFCKYKDFLSKIKHYKSVLTEKEKIEMNALELFKIDEIVSIIHKKINIDFSSC